jgi:exosortase
MTQTMGDNINRRPGKGSLADLVSVSEEPQVPHRLPAEAYIKLAVLGVLFVIVNFWFDDFWQWQILWRNWLHESDWQHGLVIPFFSLYLIYSRRHELLSVPRKASFWGLPVMIGSLLLITVGYYPIGTPFVSHVGMVFLLLGLVLYVAGSHVTRIVYVPILYWLFAMPWPKMLYSRIAFPLQNLAAKGSALMLGLFGVDITATGSALDIVNIHHNPVSLEVAEACSGIHSLMAYLALGVALAYLEDRPLWQRVTLVLCIVPVAIFTNILRVAITATMYYIDHRDWGDKFMHELTGLLMLLPTFLILWLLSWMLKRLFVEVEDSPEAEGKKVP